MLAGLQNAIVEHKAALIEQKRRVGQLFKAHAGAFCQRMISRDQNVQRFVTKRLVSKCRVLRSQATAQFKFST